MANISLGRAVLTLATETGAFVADLDNAEKHTRKLQDAVQGVGKGLQSFGRETANLGKALSLSLTAPLVAIGGAAIKVGMDAIESENLFEVSFDGMAKAARAWSQELSKALGLNEFELRRTSGVLFTMFDAMGIGKDAAFDMATSMTELSADMASFFNLRPEEAFEKLKSGITGQSEPLRSLGILVDETTVKQTAMKHGLIKQGEEMSAQQKVLARYIAIMDQTSKAQGDLGRTMDSPTNQLRQMKSQAEELAAKLGIALMPAFQQVLGMVQRLVPKVEAAVDWFTKLDPATQSTTFAILGIVAAIGPLLLIAGTLISSIGTIVGAFSGLVPIVTTVGGALAALGAGPLLAIIGTIGAVVLAWRNWDQITAFVKGVYDGVKAWMVDRFGQAVAFIQEKVDKVTGFFRGMYDAVVGNSYVPDMIKKISSEFDKLDGGMSEKTKKAVEKTKAQFKELLTDIRVLESGFGKQGLSGAITATVVELDHFTDKVLEVERASHIANFGFRGMAEELTNVGIRVSTTNDYMDEFVRNLSLFYGPTLEQASKASVSFGQTLRGAFENIPRFMGEMQTKASNMLAGLFGASPGSGLASIVSGGMNLVFGPLSGIASQLLSKGMEALGQIALKGLKKIGGFFKGLFGGASGDELAGRDLVAKFEANLAEMLADQGKLEAGNEGWKNTVIAIRDKYLEMGLTAEEALRDAERLWASSREGAEASRRVIEDIERKFRGGINVPVHVNVVTTGSIPDFGDFKPDLFPMAEGGMGRVTKPTLFLAGERGSEEYAFSGAGRSFADQAPTAARGGTAIIEVEGRTLAEVFVPYMPGVIRRYGLAR